MGEGRTGCSGPRDGSWLKLAGQSGELGRSVSVLRSREDALAVNSKSEAQVVSEKREMMQRKKKAVVWEQEGDVALRSHRRE